LSSGGWDLIHAGAQAPIAEPHRTKWVASADILNGNIGGNAAAFTDYWF